MPLVLLLSVQAHALADQIKIVPFDTPNISAARNAGISVAAGEGIAFIDDDAVPEISWLTHLTAPLTVIGGAILGQSSGGIVLSRAA